MRPCRPSGSPPESRRPSPASCRTPVRAPTPRTSWWSSSTTSASPSSAASAPTSPRRTSTGWPRTACATTGSTSPRCARRPGPRLLTGRNHHAVGMGVTQRRAASASPATPAASRSSAADAAAGPARQRLQHARRRQVAPGAAGRVLRAPGPFDRWPLGPGLRALLRLPRRRDQPVDARAGARQHARSSRRARPRRATTSPRTWSTRRSG